jgi:aryl-alcohol dehydrogenase-like predicted oxidoreductase
MKYTQFSKHPLPVSKFCLGTMNFGDRCDYPLSESIIRSAYDSGINFFDTAAMYSGGVCEEYLGKALKGIDREKIFVGTKVVKGIDRASILSGIDDSLKRLEMDYVDLYMVHWPVPGMNLTEMMSALNEVVKSGKARMIGCCNFPVYLLAAANMIAVENGWEKMVCNQVAYNLFERGIEVEILPYAVLEDIAITVYRPLAVGLLTGKFRQGQPMSAATRGASDSRVITWLTQHGAAIEDFLAFADRKGMPPSQIALAWVMHSEAITCPIVGISSLNQLKLNLEAVDISLTDDEYKQITRYFDTEVKEEGLQLFPGLTYNFPRLRRNLKVAKRS